MKPLHSNGTQPGRQPKLCNPQVGDFWPLLPAYPRPCLFKKASNRTSTTRTLHPEETSTPSTHSKADVYSLLGRPGSAPHLPPKPPSARSSSPFREHAGLTLNFFWYTSWLFCMENQRLQKGREGGREAITPLAIRSDTVGGAQPQRRHWEGVGGGSSWSRRCCCCSPGYSPYFIHQYSNESFSQRLKPETLNSRG